MKKSGLPPPPTPTGSPGHTYEREIIEEWFRDKSTSPLSNAELPSKQLTPNITLRKAIVSTDPIKSP